MNPAAAAVAGRHAAAPAAPARWDAEWVGQERDAEVLDLFESVFGHSMPLAQWRWKYLHSPVRGVLLRREGRAVAFFGGMPRTVFTHEGETPAVQNGDVMVLPSERGVFSRKGALFQAADRFFRHEVGPAAPFRFAFGFPSERHYQLGVKLGLYAHADKIRQLRWTALAPKRRLWVRTRPLDRNQLQQIEPLWQSMRASWQGHALPVRDAARWSYRYFEHPENRYLVLLVTRRFGGRPLCAVALREHGDHLEWLDFVGPAQAVPLAVQTVRYQAGMLGGKPVSGWFTEGIAPAFAREAEVRPTDIHIPVSGPHYHSWQPDSNSRLWLMGGDTDFL